MKNYNFKISFHYRDVNPWDFSIECEYDLVIVTDILLFFNDMMIINDLTGEYCHQWDLQDISNLKIEFIKKTD